MSTQKMEDQMHNRQLLARVEGIRLQACMKVAFLLAVAIVSLNVLAQTPVSAGYRDFSYGSSVSAPTGEKPESKLWWNDGSWWGDLYNSSDHAYHIYRFNLATQSWSDTGTRIDTRTASKADCLWDDSTQKLYVASYLFTNLGTSDTKSARWGRLYRYTFHPTKQSYTLDAGFPVTINQASSEVLTIAKDSTGKLWATWVQNSRPYVNHSTTSDLTWSTPFVVPTVSSSAAQLTSDDISSVIAFNENNVGVMWSNQNTATDYFVVHHDGDPDTVWQQEETAYSGIFASDDHINLKTDSGGTVYAAVKTSMTNSTSPRIVLLKRSTGGDWANFRIATGQFAHTRPIIELNPDSDQLFVFMTSPETPGGNIYYKFTTMSSPSFTDGLGTTFIASTTDTAINNATSTKQNVNSTAGLLVAASNQETTSYLHNYLSLGASSLLISSFNPTSGPAGTLVTINGTGFTNVNSVQFNGTASTNVSILSPTQIQATVSSGATTGPIRVATTSSSATSSTNFIVTTATAPVITSFNPSTGGVGTQVTITGSSFTGATVVAFNGVSATFTVVSDTQINTTVPNSALTGPISVTNAVGTTTSGASFTVTTVGKGLTFTPSGDSYVNSGNPTANYGMQTSLRLRTGNTSNPITYYSYLKFNVTGLTGSETSAKLRIFVSDATSNAVQLFSTSNAWTETTVNWNNSPAPITLLGSIASAGLNAVDIPIPASLFANGEGEYDFELQVSGTDSLVFGSKESSTPPQLIVE
jgi:uncharacterized protein (TIGR03437 family)